MKVAIVSEFSSSEDVGLESSYARAFEAMGHVVDRVALAPIKRRLPRGWNQLDELQQIVGAQRELQERVLGTAAELVLLVKGRGVLAATVSAWRAQGMRVFNLFPDSPLEGAAVDIVARTLAPQFRAVERVLVHDRFAVGQLRNMGIASEFIAFARDPWAHDIERDGADPAADPIMFIGNPDAERIRYLRAIADLGLGLYGQWEWAKLAPDDPLARCVRGGPRRGASMVRAMRSARLSINILRRCQKTAHNMRTFETPACGVCSLSEASVGVQELFDPGTENAVFHSPAELRSTALELLRNPRQIDDIARAGHDRVQGETYQRRAAEILALL